MTAHLPGTGSQTLSVSGDGGPINDADLAGTPFKGTVKFNQVSLSGAQKFLNSNALAGTDAVITGSTDLTNASGNMAAAGSLKLQDAIVHGVKVGYPISADFDIADNLNTDVMQIKKCDLKLGSTPLSVNGTVNTHPATSVVDVNLSTSNASIQDAARLAAAFGVAFSTNATIAGQVTANVHAQGPTEPVSLQRQRECPQPGDEREGHSAAGQGAGDQPGNDASANPVQQLHRDLWQHLVSRADDVDAVHGRVA